MNTRILLIAILSFSIGCTTAPEWITAPIEQNLQSNGVSFTLNLATNSFGLYDTLEGVFRVTNHSNETRTFDFSNIQQLGFSFTSSTGDIALFQPWIVSPALSNLTLTQGESKEYQIKTVFHNHTGNYISPGEYVFAAFLLDNNSPKIAATIRIK